MELTMHYKHISINEREKISFIKFIGISLKKKEKYCEVTSYRLFLCFLAGYNYLEKEGITIFGDWNSKMCENYNLKNKKSTVIVIEKKVLLNI